MVKGNYKNDEKQPQETHHKNFAYERSLRASVLRGQSVIIIIIINIIIIIISGAPTRERRAWGRAPYS